MERDGVTRDRLKFPWLKPQSIEFTDWSRRVILLPSCTACAIQSLGRNRIYALPPSQIFNQKEKQWVFRENLAQARQAQVKGNITGMTH